MNRTVEEQPRYIIDQEQKEREIKILLKNGPVR